MKSPVPPPRSRGKKTKNLIARLARAGDQTQLDRTAKVSFSAQEEAHCKMRVGNGNLPNAPTPRSRGAATRKKLADMRKDNDNLALVVTNRRAVGLLTPPLKVNSRAIALADAVVPVFKKQGRRGATDVAVRRAVIASKVIAEKIAVRPMKTRSMAMADRMTTRSMANGVKKIAKASKQVARRARKVVAKAPSAIRKKTMAPRRRSERNA